MGQYLKATGITLTILNAALSERIASLHAEIQEHGANQYRDNAFTSSVSALAYINKYAGWLKKYGEATMKFPDEPGVFLSISQAITAYSVKYANVFSDTRHPDAEYRLAINECRDAVRAWERA